MCRLQGWGGYSSTGSASRSSSAARKRGPSTRREAVDQLVYASSIQPSLAVAGLTPRPNQLWNTSCSRASDRGGGGPVVLHAPARTPHEGVEPLAVDPRAVAGGQIGQPGGDVRLPQPSRSASTSRWRATVSVSGSVAAGDVDREPAGLDLVGRGERPAWATATCSGPGSRCETECCRPTPAVAPRRAWPLATATWGRSVPSPRRPPTGRSGRGTGWPGSTSRGSGPRPGRTSTGRSAPRRRPSPPARPPWRPGWRGVVQLEDVRAGGQRRVEHPHAGVEPGTEIATGKGARPQRIAVEADPVRLLAQVEDGPAGVIDLEGDPGRAPGLAQRPRRSPGWRRSRSHRPGRPGRLRVDRRGGLVRNRHRRSLPRPRDRPHAVA